MIPWFLNKWLWLAGALVALAGWMYWAGGKGLREELGQAETQIAETAESNKISRKTQQEIDRDGYDTRKRAAAADRELYAGADPDAPAADDDGMRVVLEAHAAALRAACRVRGEKSCDGAASAREHD